MNERDENTYETKVGTTTFIVTPKFAGTQTLEEVLKYSIRRKILFETAAKDILPLGDS
jgi:hypothetical protein